jgi:pyruvate formate lyase activating enzyme
MVETSLNVPWNNVEKSACSIDNYFIDCKDVNGEIYRSYTGQDNRRMLDNLKKLIEIKGGDKIIVRVPLIKGYNNEDNRLQSKIFLKELGIPESNIDLFTYKT